jgi:hypothetical protein
MAKSFFFQNFDPSEADNEPFVRDLRRLVDARASLPDLLSRVGDYVRAGTTPDKRAIVESAAASLNLPAIEVAYHMRCLETLLAIFSENEDDTPEDLASDFTQHAAVPGDLQEALTALLSDVKAVAVQQSTLIDEVAARRGVLPLLESMTTTTELRGIFHESAKDFAGEERFHGLIGMISVHLSLDTGKSVFFQCDRTLAEYLMREMSAALRRLARIEEWQALNAQARSQTKADEESQTA